MNNYNVLYIHTHDSGHYFSPYGFKVDTPNIEEFSKDSLLFKEAYSVSPTCSPSRASLLTGKYPHNNGMIGLANRGFELNDYKSHIVNAFNEKSYKTVLCGIQHEYGKYSEHKKGAEKIGYAIDISSNCYNLNEKEYVDWDKKNTDNLCNWISKEGEKEPFFVSMGFFSTHREYPDIKSEKIDTNIPDFLKKEETVIKDWNGHLKTLKMFDDNFGKIIDSLKKNNLYNKTIILFTTDHGIPYPNAKCTLYDNGIKVAMIVRVPNSKSNGKVYEYPVSSVDIAPTLFSILNIENTNYDGIDISEIFNDVSKKIRNEIFAEINFHTSYEPTRCIKKGQYKLIHYFDMENAYPHLSNIDNSPTKDYYIKNNIIKEKKEEWELYDTSIDKNETNNLAYDVSYKTIFEDLKNSLLKWQIETKDLLLDNNFLSKKSWKNSWIVNTPSSIDPKNKDEKYFIKI